MSSSDTVAGLFIIESLRFDDERHRREGRILRDILRLSGRKVDYLYIRTEKELEDFALDRFYESKKRYLHFSCHGDKETVCLSLDELNFKKFGKLVHPYLHNRRLFFSACEVVNDELAAAIMPGSDSYSLIGPSEKIHFDDSVLMWASFYHLMFRDGDDAMKGGRIRWALRRVRSAFQKEFDYFKTASSKEGYERVDIDKK